MIIRSRLMRAAVVGTLAFVSLAGCGGESTPTEEGQRPAADIAPPSPTSTTSARPTTSAAPTTATTSSILAPCGPDMGTTLREDLIDAAPTAVPGTTRPGPEEGFDWDLDGRPDRLIVGEPDGQITLDWGTGQLTVTGVHTDFTIPISDEDGLEYVVRNTGPGSAEELADGHRPAAVGDVTGDGWLDLIVTQRATAAVLAGAGGETVTGSVAFDEVGTDTPGWRSPPVRSPQRTDAQGNPAGTPPLWPMPIGNVNLWRDADGSEGFAVSTTLDRTIGPLVLYDGIPCATRPPPAGG